MVLYLSCQTYNHLVFFTPPSLTNRICTQGLLYINSILLFFLSPSRMFDSVGRTASIHILQSVLTPAISLGSVTPDPFSPIAMLTAFNIFNKHIIYSE